jgi:transposase
MPQRIKLRRFYRGEKQWLNTKLHDRKLPVWLAQRYRLIALVYAGLSVFAAARRLGCAKETAYRWIQEFNRIGFRKFNRSSHPEGRPSQLSQRQLELLYHIAQKRPTDVGLPFTTWSMTKLQAYLVKKRHFPQVSPEWLRQLLRRAKISWQRTKTWKQSHDPQFKSKKSAFWRSTPSAPSVASSCVTTSLAPSNCARSRAGVGPIISIHNGSARPIPANGAWNSCMGSMMCMPIAWSDGFASAKRPRTLSYVSSACERAIQSSSAFMW